MDLFPSDGVILIFLKEKTDFEYAQDYTRLIEIELVLGVEL